MWGRVPDPELRAEIQESRPALVLQNDIGNQHSLGTIVAVITSNVVRRGSTGILVTAPDGGLAVDSVILLNQIRAIDKRRFGRRLGVLPAVTVAQIDRALMISLGQIDR